MEVLRPLLITYAYNIVGTYEDAKDIVQDAFLKFISVADDGIENKRAYLIRIVVNLAINFKNRQRKHRAQYPGQWLPEPIAAEGADLMIIQKEVLSYSLMVLLEKLNARQRAVFILKEAFDYTHEEIGDVLSMSAENSRKLLSRAKDQLKSAVPGARQNISVSYLDKFLHILRTGDTLQLEKLLKEDVMITSDGGGKATAFMNRIMGRKDVMSVLTGLFRKFYHDVKIDIAFVNHQPALFYYHNEELVNCQILSIENGRIADIFFMRNPDKLKTLKKIY